MLTVDLIEQFINSIMLSSKVLSISDDGTNTTITVVNTYHLRFDMIVSVDTVDYTVLSCDSLNNTFVVAGVIASAVSIVVPNPFYFHGTPYATNSHISYLSDSEKVPMIYLREIFREVQQSQDSNIDRESSLELHFLDVSNYEDWNTDDYYTKVILGLNKLVDKFIQSAISYNRFYLYEQTFERVNAPKWGAVNDIGSEDSMFNERLSGVIVIFTLPIRKSCN